MRAAVLLILAGAAVSPGCPAAGPSAEPPAALKEDPGAVRSSEGTFAVAVEQGGRRVATKDHVARVRKEAFTLVLEFPARGGVLVNVSDSGAACEAARGQWRQLGHDGGLARRIEEADGNPQHQVVLAEKAWHHWYMYGPNSHRFEAVTARDGVYECRRTVEATMRPGGRREEIGRYPGETMYFVFVRATGDGARAREQDRGWLKIVFE